MEQVSLMPQESKGNARFTGQLVMTRGFDSAFNGEGASVALEALSKIINERVIRGEGADYLQVAVCMGIRFWIIDDGSVVTFLLPSEY